MKYNYRNTEFTKGERFYSCSDKGLLEGVETRCFQSYTIQEMKQSIDHFIDNRDHLLYCEELNAKAIMSTYENEGYQLD